MPNQPGTSAQRIRIGLTGLAFAFILVLLGSIVSRSSRDDAPNNAAQVASNQGSEPLAELGVAPGPTNDTTVNNGAVVKK
jgi:hypothetical protein